MKFQLTALAVACAQVSAFSFVPSASNIGVSSSSSTKLSMVLEKPKVEKKLAKIEVLKTNSDHLIHPLKEVSLFPYLFYCYNQHKGNNHVSVSNAYKIFVFKEKYLTLFHPCLVHG